MFCSIIVPIYNIKDYLRKCVNSLLAQDCQDYEIILVDDGSSDGSSELCDAFSEKHEIVRVIHKTNGGLSDARNAGIHIAKGRYILFVDGDDYIEQNCLSRIFQSCLEQNFPEVLFLNILKVFPDGKEIFLDEKMRKDKIYGRGSLEVLSYISSLRKYPASVGCKLVLRECILSNNLFFEYGAKSEDLDWTKKVLFNARSFGCYNGKYYYYRQNREGSISNSLSYNNFNDICMVIDRWIEEANKSSLERKKILYSFSCYEYKILLAIYYEVENCYRKYAMGWLKKNQWLLDYKDDTQVKLIRYVCKFFGISITSKLLHCYIRKRRT